MKVTFIAITILINILMGITLYFIGHIYGGKDKLSFKEDTPEDQVFIKSAFVTYAISALIQQVFVLTIFSLLKYLAHLPGFYCITISALIFFCLHFPNIVLMFAVLGMEFLLLTGFNAVGLWYIPFMVMTHSILATCLLLFFPTDFTKGFRVLWMFFQYYYPKKIAF